jgi:hypothetical protein
VSYLLNRLFVFRSDRKHAHAVMPFVAVTLFSGLLVQSAVIWLVMHVGESATPHAPTEVLTPFAKVCATAVGMISNFLGYRLLFGEASSDRGRVDEPAAASTGGSDRGRTRQPYRSVRNRQSSGKRTTSSMDRR